MASPVTIFSGTTGLNNTVDQVRQDFNLETGVVDLSEAVNVRIDKTGRPVRRDGFSLRHGGNFHSLFTRGNTGYVGLDDAVYRINPDLSLTGARNGLSGKRITYVWTPLGVIYSNGSEKGILDEDISREWKKTEKVRAESTRYYTGPPDGISHLEMFASRIFAAVEDTLWRSQPNDYGLFRQGADYNQFPSRIRMVRAVAGGIYVSDESRTYFLPGSNPEEFERRVVMEAPALEYSDLSDLVDPSDIGMEGANPFAVWVSTDGLVYGSPDGQVILPAVRGFRKDGIQSGIIIRQEKRLPRQSPVDGWCLPD